MRLRTLTLSSGFDVSIRVDSILPAEVSRVLSWDTFAAGKGLNVARVATHLGVPATAYALTGAEDSDEFVHAAIRQGTDVVLVAVPGPTRRNLTLSVGDLNAPASHAVGERFRTATDAHADDLLLRLLNDTRAGDLVTLNGATPNGIRGSFWAEATEALARRGATVIADLQGDSLVAALATRCLTMTKPNLEEISEVLGSVSTDDPLLLAKLGVATMANCGVRDPIVSLGVLGATHLVNAKHARTVCEVTKVAITVGAGDALVAGYCAALFDRSLNSYSPVQVGVATAAALVAGDFERISSSADGLSSVRARLAKTNTSYLGA